MLDWIMEAHYEGTARSAEKKYLFCDLYQKELSVGPFPVSVPAKLNQESSNCPV